MGEEDDHITPLNATGHLGIPIESRFLTVTNTLHLLLKPFSCPVPKGSQLLLSIHVLVQFDGLIAPFREQAHRPAIRVI